MYVNVISDHQAIIKFGYPDVNRLVDCRFLRNWKTSRVNITKTAGLMADIRLEERTNPATRTYRFTEEFPVANVKNTKNWEITFPKFIINILILPFRPFLLDFSEIDFLEFWYRCSTVRMEVTIETD